VIADTLAARVVIAIRPSICHCVVPPVCHGEVSFLVIASPDLSGRGNLTRGWRKQAPSICHGEFSFLVIASPDLSGRGNLLG